MPTHTYGGRVCTERPHNSRSVWGYREATDIRGRTLPPDTKTRSSY